MELVLGIRWQLGDDLTPLDPRLFVLLHAVTDAGSLRAAARAAGLSYRHAWGMLQAWEQRLGTPLASLERGRGARLTPLGERLLWAEQRARLRLDNELEGLAAALREELEAAAATARAPVRIFASHGLAVGILRELALERGAPPIALHYRGSLESLRLFAAGRCELAGFHLPEGELGADLGPRFRPWLRADRHRLVHVVRRRQGLMTAPGNPLGLRHVGDLTRPEVRFVNRQPDSGTRLLLDLLLRRAGVDTRDVRGYHSEEFTHMAVAAMVATGAADAGFGIEATARHFGLDFLPVVWERYYLALERDNLSHPIARLLLEVLASDAWHARVRALPGYDTAESGRVLSAGEVLPRERRLDAASLPAPPGADEAG